MQRGTTGLSSWTDKAYHHGYDRIYPTFLGSLRSSPVRMLEVGFLNGNSVLFWGSYFPAAQHIAFFDIDPFYVEHCPCRISDLSHNIDLLKNVDPATLEHMVMHGGDQANPQDLQRMMEAEGKPFDVIVDDGGHSPRQQLITFQELFPKHLSPGGVFIIEDVQLNYNDIDRVEEENRGDYGFNLVHEFQRIVDVVNRRFRAASESSKESKPLLGSEVTKHIESITFAYNCIIVTKRLKRFDHFNDAPYAPYLAAFLSPQHRKHVLFDRMQPAQR